MSYFAFFGVAFFVAVVVLAVVVLAPRVSKGGFGKGSTNLASGRLKKKALMTANELEFIERLESAVPEMRFHTQVSMGALMDPVASRKESGKEFFRLRGMFTQKIVDFVAQNRHDGSVVAIIELDDRTHDPEKDSKRDLMLSGAGYKIVRWHSKAKPDLAAIRTELLAPCPRPPHPGHNRPRLLA